MTDRPLISILMAVYNVSRYLPKCLDSIMVKTLDDFELVVVNDGSTDDSRNILSRYERVSRVRVIDQDNAGVSAARNRGLDEARGEYVTFIDPDDYVSPDYLKVLYEAIRDEHVPVSVVAHQVVYGDEPEKNEGKKMTGIAVKSARRHVLDMVGPRMFGTYVWAKMFKRTMFDGFRFPLGEIYEDTSVVPYVIYDAGNVAYVESPHYFYRQRPDSFLAVYNENRKYEVYALGRLVDFAVSRKDRRLCWYARINEVRSYLEIRHRFKKHGYDFSPIQEDFKGRIGRDLIRILIPIF